MEDNRLYLVKPLSYWESGRAQHLFKLSASELEAAQSHPQGIIREEEDRVLVIQQDAKEYIQKEADAGRASEVLKRHDAKRRTKNAKLTR